MKKIEIALINQLTEEDIVLRMIILCMYNSTVEAITLQKFEGDYLKAFKGWKKLPSYRSLLELLHIYSVTVNKREYFVHQNDIDMGNTPHSRMSREVNMGNVGSVHYPIKAEYVF